MNAVMAKQEQDEAAEHAEIEGVRKQLQDKEGEANGEVSNAQEQLEALRQYAGTYKSKVAAAEQHLSASLAREADGDYHTQVSNLKSKLAALASLLQEGDSIQDGLENFGKSPQVLALQHLNDELRHENAALRKQDERL